MNLTRIKLTLLLLTAALSSSISFADGDYDLGQEKSTTCVGCHGETGVSVSPQYPNLGGQHEDYIIQALKDYKDGDRNNAIMKGFAGVLSNQDMADLAAYYSAQQGLFTPTEDQW